MFWPSGLTTNELKVSMKLRDVKSAKVSSFFASLTCLGEAEDAGLLDSCNRGKSSLSTALPCEKQKPGLV